MLWLLKMVNDQVVKYQNYSMLIYSSFYLYKQGSYLERPQIIVCINENIDMTCVLYIER